MTDIAPHMQLQAAGGNSRAVRRFMRHRLALLGFAMITLLVLACVFGPYAPALRLAPHRSARPLCSSVEGHHFSALTRWAVTWLHGS